MNTKRLVLGFCALAAVTGSAPGFGDDIPSVEPLAAASPVQLYNYKVDIPAKKMLTKRIPSSKRRAAYAKALAATEKELKAKTVAFVKMSDDEVACVKKALLYERRAHILGEIAVRNLKLADDEIERIQKDVTEAEKARDEARRFILWKKAKVAMLESKLARAKQRRECRLKQIVASCHKANGHLDEAIQAREEAATLRTQRIAALIGLTNEEISERKMKLEEDCKKMEQCSFFNTDVESMELRAIQNLVTVQEVVRRYNYVTRVTKCLADAFGTDLKGNDYAWFRRKVGGGRDLYYKSLDGYKHQSLDYDCDDKAFDEQIDRLCPIFSQALTLENMAGDWLERYSPIGDEEPLGSMECECQGFPGYETVDMNPIPGSGIPGLQPSPDGYVPQDIVNASYPALGSLECEYQTIPGYEDVDLNGYAIPDYGIADMNPLPGTGTGIPGLPPPPGGYMTHDMVDAHNKRTHS